MNELKSLVSTKSITVYSAIAEPEPKLFSERSESSSEAGERSSGLIFSSHRDRREHRVMSTYNEGGLSEGIA
jgi:hypothetical protein